MKTYREVKEIAKCIAKAKKLAAKLEEENDCFDALDWNTAEFVSLSKEDIKYFEKNNGVTGDYYVEQHTGYCEDDFYGWLWFKTDVPGQYIKVHFCC